MSGYKPSWTSEFFNDTKKIKENTPIGRQLKKKIYKILEKPYCGKALSNVLKNRRRVHVGSFVLTFEAMESKNIVTFHSFKHHDDAYK